MKHFITRITPAIMLSMAVCACEYVDLKPHEGEWGDINGKDNSLYCCAVEYDSGYDWRRDTLGGFVPSRILLFKDGKKISSVDLTEEEFETTDMDMHGMYGGYLYSVHNMGNEIVVKKNGFHTLSFPNDGTVARFYVDRGTFHSISIPHKGSGIIYKVNGKTVLDVPKAVLMGDLYEDKGEVCFAYAQPMESTGTTSVARYHFVAGGRDTLITTLPTVSKVMAIRRSAGVLNLMQMESGVKGAVWMKGKESYLIDIQNNNGMRDYSFIQSGDKLYAHLQAHVASSTGYNWNDYFWINGQTMIKTGGSDQVIATASNKGALCYASAPGYESSPVSLYNGKGSLKLSASLKMISPYGLCCKNGRLIAGLAKTPGYTPCIFDNGEYEDYDFNGYFTHVCLP